MKRRLLLGMIGMSPLAIISSKIPNPERSIVDILINRWKKSKDYTMLVLDAMPEDQLEYRPTPEQMSFVQHFMHMGFTNNAFIGTLMDSNSYEDFNALMEAQFFLERPDPISLFQPDSLQKRTPQKNKELVANYLAETFDYVINSLNQVKDENLKKGKDKVKPWYLEGHTNLDLILRAESHTAHHRAQAICYLRMKGIQPPGYSKNNTL